MAAMQMLCSAPGTGRLTLKLDPSARNPDAAVKPASQSVSVVLIAMEFICGVSKRYCPGVDVVPTFTV